VRKAVRRNRARLVVASARPSTLDPNAAATLRFAPGCAEAALAGLAAALGSPRAPSASLGDRARAARAAEADVRGAADVLRGAGDVVIVWGERVVSGERGAETIEALLAVAGALGLSAKPESGLIEVPAGTNGRGLREVGCLPGTGPGLADAGDGMSAEDVAEADELGALLLVERELPASTLARASAVIAFARFPSEALEEHADVVFPAEIYPEKEGTLTHPDGRLQRVRQALGRAGDVRPGWQVLAELCERAGAGVGALAAPMVTAALCEAVPFYAGLTLEEIGGLGVRWQERDAASALDAPELSSEALAEPPPAPEGLRLATVPTLWSGPETEHSPSLRFLGGRRVAELSVEDAQRAAVENGAEVRLSASRESVVATAVVRSGVPAGSVFVSGVDLPAGSVQLAPAHPPVEAVAAGEVRV
jgi:NADH-quinone oxidoreductase subunit G